EKRLKTTKKDSLQKQYQKMQATLMQKGFTYDVISDVMEEVKNNQDTDKEWDALMYHGGKLHRRHGRKYTGIELQEKIEEEVDRQGFPFKQINKIIDEQVKE